MATKVESASGLADDMQETLEVAPGFTGIGYPEVFTTKPPQPTVKKPGQLSEECVDKYFKEGFLVVEDFFTLEEIEPCKVAYARLVDDIAKKLHATGRIKDTFEDHGLEDRLILLDKAWPGAIMLLLKLGKLTPEFRAMYQNDKLLNVMEQLIGPEIAANPVWNTRPKCPGHEETHVPWHQDSGYFDMDSYSTLVATAWIAFVDVTTENGCLEFFRGGHKKGMVGVHECCQNFYLMLEEEELVKRFGAVPEKDFVKCPTKAGSVIFFSNVIPHRSIPNKSKHTRWAMDLRYQSPNEPYGFYGLKSGILLRSPSAPDHVPDWDAYDDQDRYEIQKEHEIKKTGKGKVDEFDTKITGPWMDKWHIQYHTEDVQRYFDEKAQKEQNS